MPYHITLEFPAETNPLRLVKIQQTILRSVGQLYFAEIIYQLGMNEIPFAIYDKSLSEDDYERIETQDQIDIVLGLNTIHASIDSDNSKPIFTEPYRIGVPNTGFAPASTVIYHAKKLKYPAFVVADKHLPIFSSKLMQLSVKFADDIISLDLLVKPDEYVNNTALSDFNIEFNNDIQDMLKNIADGGPAMFILFKVYGYSQFISEDDCEELSKWRQNIMDKLKKMLEDSNPIKLPKWI